MPDITRTIEIPAPPSAVWRWLSSEEGLRCWLSPELEIDLRVGGAYRMPGGDGKTQITGTVLTIVPEGSLVLAWMVVGSDWVHPGRLRISLEPLATGTRVELVHDGFAGIGTTRWSEVERGYERGAERHQVLERLAHVVSTRD